MSEPGIPLADNDLRDTVEFIVSRPSKKITSNYTLKHLVQKGRHQSPPPSLLNINTNTKYSNSQFPQTLLLHIGLLLVLRLVHAYPNLARSTPTSLLCSTQWHLHSHSLLSPLLSLSPHSSVIIPTSAFL
jgi:hypothetical protein